MTAGAIPGPKDAGAFLDFLISRRSECLALDTFQLSAAMALLGEVWAEAPTGGEAAPERFWRRLLPVLATSADSRAAWRAALAGWTAPARPEPKIPSAAPTPEPRRDPPPARTSGPGGLDIRTTLSLAAATIIALIGAAAFVFSLRHPPPKLSHTPPSRTLVAPKGIQTFTRVPKTVTVRTPDKDALFLARALILAAPVVVLAVCGLWLRAHRNTLLSSQPRDEARDARGFLQPLQGAVAHLINSADLGPLARDLGASVRTETRGIDVARTVRATARRAGAFTPVRRARRITPEYLAVIERRSPADHMAELYTALLERLRTRGVDVRTFHYRTDPRFLAEITPLGPRPADLESLAGARDGQRVLVLGDIDAFLQPFSDEPWPWVERFAPWETRALLDPRARLRDERGEALWGAGEARLAEAGWLIGTARMSGLARLGAHLTRPKGTPFLEGRPMLRPAVSRSLVSDSDVGAPQADDPETPIGKYSVSAPLYQIFKPPDATPRTAEPTATPKVSPSSAAPHGTEAPPFPGVIDWGVDDFGSFARIAVGGVTQTLRWIPPGTFWMGSPEDEPGRHEDEGPRHAVTLSAGFWLFDTPCTQALWEAVMGDNPSAFRGPARPVETVSWNDARDFIARINDRLPGLGLSLPTEAQWEYACRAGTTTATWIGPVEIGEDGTSPALDPIAWYAGNSGGETHPVGLKAPNAWGLRDVLGHVWEWCDDSLRPYGTEATDPVGAAAGGTRRVVRGGSWYDAAACVRAAYRGSNLPSDRFNALGFRCARVSSSAEGWDGGG